MSQKRASIPTPVKTPYAWVVLVFLHGDAGGAAEPV